MSLTQSELNRLTELVDALARQTALAPDQCAWLENLRARLPSTPGEAPGNDPVDGSLKPSDSIQTLYRHLVENQPDLICRFLPDTTLTFVNQAYADFFRKQPEDLLGTRFIDFLAAEDRPAVLLTLSAFTPTAPSRQYVHPTVNATGEQHWHLWHDYAHFDENHQPIEIQSVGVDITDRKQIEADMEQIGKVFLTLGKDFDADVARLTEMCGRLLKADVAFYNRKKSGALFSYGMFQPPADYDPAKPLQGQMCEGLLTKPHERCTVLHHLSNSRFARSNPDVLKFGFETYIGHPVFCRGATVGVLCALFYDHVTFGPADEYFMALLAFALGEQEERTLALSEQRKLHAELALAQNIESVGRLAGGIAHDFNNQLTVIAGLAEILQMNAGDSGETHEELTEILNAARRATLLTNKLLGFARRQPIHPVALNLNKAIQDMLPMLQQATRKVRLQWRPCADNWPVMIDPAQLDQILAQLLANAHDAVAPGGLISVETANLTIASDGPKPAADLAPGDYVIVRVIDNGMGIDPELLERVFEPFFTTKQGGIGTGLGLSTVYGIVKQNHGTITAHSEPGKGATFAVYLPRHATEPAAAKPPLPAGVSTGHGERILVVEDEVGILNLARRILEKSGYTVMSANGPTEALRMMEESAGQIDLVLSDVMMPEMNGPALIERLLVDRPDLKVIYMSGFTADLIREKGKLHQRHPFLQKPFSIATLSAAVQSALAEK